MSVPSTLLFGPQTKLPAKEQSQDIRNFLTTSPALRPFLNAIQELPSFWDALVASDRALDCVPGQQSIDILLQWLNGQTIPSFDSENNSLCTPLTVIVQIVQYFQYLAKATLRHDQVLASATAGGVQGFCTGILSALAISSCCDEEEIAAQASVALRLALCIGAYVDSARPTNSSKMACIVVRSQTPGKIRELPHLLERWKQAYVSVIYDQDTVTLTVPKSEISEVGASLFQQGFTVRNVSIEGLFHSSLNENALEKILRLCESDESLRLPYASSLKVPVRSNTDGKVITEGLLSAIAAPILLTEVSDWYKTMSATVHSIMPGSDVMVFGLSDVIPASIQREQRLRITRAWASSNENPSKPEHKHPENSIAIVGMSAKYAGVDSLGEFWDVIASGKSMCTELPRDRWPTESLRRSKSGAKFYGNFLRDVEAFDHKFFKKSSKEAAAMDPQQRLLLEASYQALESSGYFTEDQPPEDIGCFVGVATTDYHDNIASHPANAFSALGELRAFLCGRISYHFGWTGPSMTFDTACSASMVAIDSACRAIQTGQCSRALAGGVSANSSPNLWENLRGASFLSPTGPTKPFDENADGYCRGEGVGLVLLKKLSDAVKDNDFVLGVIPATGVNQAKNETYITVPHGKSQQKLYEKVIAQSGLQPDEFSFVEAHGTGTQKGDPAEMESLRGIFGTPSRTEALHVGSVKGNVGHCEAASGVASVIKTVLMMQQGSIPPIANHHTLNPKIPTLETHKLAIPKSLLPWNASFKAALINNYGAAGSNGALALCQAPASGSAGNAPVFSKVPIFISANSDESLASYCDALRTWIPTAPNATAADFLPNLAYNLARKQNRSLRPALATSVANVAELIDKLGEMKPNVEDTDNKPVVLVFGGQTTSYVGLSQDVYHGSAIFRSHLEHCDQVIKSTGFKSIFPAIFQAEPVSDLVNLHSMFLAIQYACAKTWMSCGVAPAAVVGHSFGQLTALCISGALSLEDTVKLVAGRATLMQKFWGEEPGSMVALEADTETSRRIVSSLSSSEPSTEIACYNGAASHVLVGSSAAMDKVEEACKTGGENGRSIRCRRLRVTNGFHSTFTDPLIPELEKLASELTVSKPNITLETCSDSASWDEITPSLIAQHTRAPVYFQAAVERLEEHLGACTWLEAGSASSVTGMVRRAVASPSAGHTFHPVQLNDKDAIGSLAETTTSLMKVIPKATFWPFHKSQHEQYRAFNLPPYQFEKHRHWLKWKDYAEAPIYPEAPSVGIDEDPMELLRCIEADQGKARFAISSQNEEFQTFVKGHAVLGQPLCPADLYVELVHRAVCTLAPNAAGCLPAIEKLSIVAPLGIDPTQKIFLELTQQGDATEWKFLFSSRSQHGGEKDVQHASGFIALSPPDDAHVATEFSRYSRLMGSSRAETVLEDPDSEGMQGPLVYKLFSKVVSYGKYYQGVREIAAKGNEVAARISMPRSTPSSSNMVLDPVLIDNFVQVAGIKDNILNYCPPNQVFICGHIDRIQTSPVFLDKSKTPQIWSVVAHCTSLSEKEYVNDIYVFSEDGQLAMIILGVQFTRVAIASLAKILATSNSASAQTKSQPSQPSPPKTQIAELKSMMTQGSLSSSSSSTPSLTGSSSPQSGASTPLTQTEPSTPVNETEKEGSAAASRDRLAKLVSEQLETSAPMLNDTLLEDHGLDSLLTVELKGEVESAFSVTLASDAIHSSITFGELFTLVNAQAKPEPKAAGSLSDISLQPRLAASASAIPRTLQDVGPNEKRRPGDRMKTVLFHTADNTPLYADIYLPDESQITESPRPVALMVHGGGFTMLSRKDVRPKQTALLLTNGFLPVSIDYRLCPEVSVHASISDVASALQWARNILPTLDLEIPNLHISSEKVAVIGWSTGGTLALQLGYAAERQGVRPPDATLAFYCPSNFEDAFWTQPNFPENTNEDTLAGYDLLEGVHDTPITGYNVDSKAGAVGGWMAPSDPRSRIVLHMNWRAQMVPIIANGLPSKYQAALRGMSSTDFAKLERPSTEQVVAISPYAQIKKGNYKVPTYLIHGTKDDLIPWEQPKTVLEALREAGVDSGLSILDGAEHLFDLYRSKGREWDVVLEGYEFLFSQLR
ncbi:ketoacyl-synt-domain-containing protein [Lojkania enalia]|uniref:Ketoacyl-synt-domain-containing protein n=1 Tax=Lojkania enalia TaxID=147567 RepID=A0A9P4MYY5_9PLEO|nr:ketoacyl-synt-domain-containing protein [Didymosphaeria enalia]